MTSKSKRAIAAKSTLSDGTISPTLKIDKATIAKAYQSVLSSTAKEAEIKGFRKGKAPLKMVEQTLDKAKLYSRVLELVLPPVYSQAIRDGKHQPIIVPKITPLKMEEGKDWEFKAETAGVPEVKLGNYRDYIKKALAKAAKTHKKDQKAPDKETGPKQDNWQLRTVLDAILEHVEVTPSPILVAEEAHSAIRKLESQLAPLKLTLDNYLKSIKKSHQELDEEYHKSATTNLRLEFALKEIVTHMNPEVTQAEIDELKPTKEQIPYAKYLLQKQKVLDTLVKL